MVSEKMYFEKELWGTVFGKTKYFNQKPWDIATNRKIREETTSVIQLLYLDYLNNEIPIEDFYYISAMALKNHRTSD